MLSLFNLSDKIKSDFYFVPHALFLTDFKFSKISTYYFLIKIIYQRIKCIFAKTSVH